MHQILGVDEKMAVKRKNQPYTRNEGMWGGTAMKETGQHQALAALPSGKDQGTQ
jgi:hypothetical protein